MKQIVILILLLAALASSFFVGRDIGVASRQPAEIIERIDTVRDTLQVPKPYAVHHYHVRTDTDTVLTVDSVPVVVNIPITAKVYADSSYRAVVSGYKANLDSISIFKNTIIKTRWYPKMYNPKWSVGIQGGGTWIKGLTPYVGVGIQYNFFSW